jgi:hypothetical protein
MAEHAPPTIAMRPGDWIIQRQSQRQNGPPGRGRVRKSFTDNVPGGIRTHNLWLRRPIWGFIASPVPDGRYVRKCRVALHIDRTAARRCAPLRAAKYQALAPIGALLRAARYRSPGLVFGPFRPSGPRAMCAPRRHRANLRPAGRPTFGAASGTLHVSSAQTGRIGGDPPTHHIRYAKRRKGHET